MGTRSQEMITEAKGYLDEIKNSNNEDLRHFRLVCIDAVITEHHNALWTCDQSDSLGALYEIQDEAREIFYGR